MNERILSRRPALALAVLCMTLCGAKATPLLQQLPLGKTDAAATASFNQADLLVQGFSFSGTATSLSWWGTAAATDGFEVSLQQGLDSKPDFSIPWTVTRHSLTSQIGLTVLEDDDNDPSTPMVERVQLVAVHRFSIDLGALPGGEYSLALWETTEDELGRTWFWLHGDPAAPGNESRTWTFEPPTNVQPYANRNLFALSLLVEGERGGTVPEPATALLVAAALGLLGTRASRRRGPAV